MCVVEDTAFAPSAAAGVKSSCAKEDSPWWEDLAVEVPEIARYDNWDRRECAVGNAQQWRDAVHEYLEVDQEIPKVMHQIWVGPKEPPCVWLDTWRVDYCHDNPSWQYQLWSDREVAKMDMINRDLYDEERMWQCKADILRLEILYQYGGVYIDADMVSLRKSIDDVVASADESQFLIMYEPDTKDKPYSVIGNSFIAATPRHPIVKMLILYIRSIYHHKRPYHGVEWVTGPLAFTKCLAHTAMPMTVPPTSYFYPQFHFVPNPDAIDLDAFPGSYAFQFGYTCSGLEGWVKNNNRCKRALLCGVHRSRSHWPMGTLRAFPSEEDGVRRDADEGGKIPRVIHQFAFQAVDARPERWMRLWSEQFVAEQGAEWSYRLWSLEDLKYGSYFAANLYRDDRAMDAEALQLLALEVLYSHGGYYVPLSVLHQGGSDEFFTTDAKFVEASGVVGSVANGSECLQRIKDIYNGQAVQQSQFVGRNEDPSVLSLGYSDASASYCSFPEWSRFLGAGAIYDLTFSAQCEQTLLAWGYDSNVPVYHPSREDALELLKKEGGRFVVATDPEIVRFRAVVDAIAGMLKALDEQHPNWRVMLVGVEWEAGQNEFCTYLVTMPCAPPQGKYLAAVFNENCTDLIPNCMETFYQELLDRHHEMELYVGCEKFEYNRDLSEIFASIPAVQHAFRSLAGHEAPIEYDQYETHGTLMKGFRDGRLALEINADRDRRVMYRAWNDDGGLNCEMKMQAGFSGDSVEWMRVYFAHAVVFDANNKRVGA